MIPGIISDAVVYSALTALMSVGLTLNYMTTRVPNFAQGTFITVGVYISFVLFTFEKISPYLASPLAFLIGGLIGLLVYLFALRPLARIGLPHVLQIVATFAVSVIFVGIFGILVDYLTTSGVGNAAFFILTQADFSLFGLGGIVFAAPVVLGLLATILFIFVNKTKFGVGLKAAVENPALAEIVGINVEATRMFSWFLSGGLAALAGALIVLWIPGSDVIGSQFLLVIFAAAILGGLFNIFGTILGGIVVGGGAVLLTGLLSGMVGSWVAEYQPAIPLLIMAGTLILAPQGILSLNWRRVLTRTR